MSAGTFSLVPDRPSGNWVGLGGGSLLRDGQEQHGSELSYTDANVSPGQEIGTDGKLAGMTPRETSASHKSSLPHKSSSSV